MLIHPERTLFSVLVLVTTAAASLPAQKRLSVAADAGLTDGKGRGGDYDNRTLQGFRFAASARFGAKHIGMFAEVSKESLGSLYGDKLICQVGTNGQCVPSFPQMHGWSTSIGVLVRPRHFLEGRIGIGPAWYVPRGQNDLRLTALAALADVAVYPVSHVGVALAVQQVTLARYRGDRLSVRPFTVALRAR